MADYVIHFPCVAALEQPWSCPLIQHDWSHASVYFRFMKSSLASSAQRIRVRKTARVLSHQLTPYLL